MITIVTELMINENIGKVWNILGPDFVNTYKWASLVNHSEGKGPGVNGAPCSERGCDIAGMGKVREKIIQYSDKEYLLSYQAAEGMPSMVKSAINTWQLFEIDNSRVKLIMKMSLKVGGLMGFLMKPMMKMQMGKMARVTAEDFKYYVERGLPSSRKVKAMKKYKG